MTEREKKHLRDLWIMRIEDVEQRCRDVGLEYIGGYTGCDSMVTVKCLSCGYEFERSFVCIRKKQKHRCKICCEIAKQEETKRKKIAKDAERIKEKERKQSIEWFFSNIQNECYECGRTFTPARKNQKYCSDECKKRKANRKTDGRFAKFGTKLVDSDISVQKLYERDHGLCWICGSMCDKSNKRMVNGVVICGESYPSVDHIIPVSEGGEHSWHNVKLAHRGCNSKRFWIDQLPQVAEIKSKWLGTEGSPSKNI